MRELNGIEQHALIEFAEKIFGKRTSCPVTYDICADADAFPARCHGCNAYEAYENMCREG